MIKNKRGMILLDSLVALSVAIICCQITIVSVNQVVMSKQKIATFLTGLEEDMTMYYKTMKGCQECIEEEVASSKSSSLLP